MAGKPTLGDGGPLGLDYYEALDTTSQGFEVEVSGHVADHWLLSDGFTHLKIEDDQGPRTQNQVPRSSIKLAATFEVPEWHGPKLGSARLGSAQLGAPLPGRDQCDRRQCRAADLPKELCSPRRAGRHHGGRTRRGQPERA